MFAKAGSYCCIDVGSGKAVGAARRWSCRAARAKRFQEYLVRKWRLKQLIEENLREPSKPEEAKRSEKDPDTFLADLREQVEGTLLEGAKDPKKITVGDYLKLVALIEERRRVSPPGEKEIVVRWEDPSEEDDACS